MPVTKEQEEEFLKRRAAGSKLSLEEVEEFNKTGVKLTQEQYQAFFDATEEKLNGNS